MAPQWNLAQADHPHASNAVHFSFEDRLDIAIHRIADQRFPYGS
jgi:hypothetical protein